jgi:RNA polymerase sigma factor (sigma-70 family)
MREECAVFERAIAPLIIGRSESRQADAPGGEILVRDDLVTHHTALVRTLASRLAVRVPRQVELEELIAVGMVGLIDAAARYRPSFGVRFDVFARRRINGAMLDALRQMDWVPRSLRRMRRDLDGARARLRQALGREPEDAENRGVAQRRRSCMPAPARSGPRARPGGRPAVDGRLRSRGH